MKKITKSPEATFRIGAEVGRTLEAGDCLALYGDLGTGKTTFTKGLAKGLGIKEKILSPSFVILKVYGGRLAHYDFYRIDRPDKMLESELAEIVGIGTHVVVIEWPEKLVHLPQKCKKVKFTYLDKDTRVIEYQ